MWCFGAHDFEDEIEKSGDIISDALGITAGGSQRKMIVV